MIYIYKSPVPNRILLDANNTVISITSSNGLGFYFRAKIYIDDQLFDEQSWSRKDDFTAEKDLKKLYNAYYETIFSPNFTSGLEQQIHLIKKITIVINEHSIGDDSLIQSQNLPDFYLMYNAKPVVFNDLNKVQFLGITPDVLQVPTTGKLSIPFMVNASNEALLVELKDNFGNTIDSRSKPNFTDKRVYVYNFDFSSVVLVAKTLYFSLTITIGTTVIIKNIRLFESPKFDIKEITFLNSFGYWCYGYLDGQLSIDNNLDIKTYEELDGGEKVYEINEKQTYTINTGALLASEKDIINQICTALEAKIYLNSEYIKMINATKKINMYKDKNNLYSENLTFSVRQNNSVDNPFYAVEDYDANDYDSNDYTT
jgi:hypothetical protein